MTGPVTSAEAGARGSSGERVKRAALLLVIGLVAAGSPVKYRRNFHPANETGRVHAAMAVIDHGTLHLDAVWDDVYPDWRASGRLPNMDVAQRDGHYLLDKPPGITLLALPVVALLRVAGANLELADLLWLVSLLLAALPCILFVLVFRRWLHGNLGRGRAVAIVAPAVVFATPWVLFGSQAFGHSLAAALTGTGAFLALGPLGAGGPDEKSARKGFLGGLALGGAVLMELPCAFLAAGAGLALLLDPDRRRRLPWLLLGGLGPALVLLSWNAASFGDPLSSGYALKVSPGLAAEHGHGFLGLSRPRLEALYGLLLSPRRGLFFLAPWLLLAPAGAVWALRDRAVSRAWRTLLLLSTLGAPVLMSGYAGWVGGPPFGPRYLVFVLPLFGVAAALAMDRIERGRLAALALPVARGLLISSFALMLVANAGVPFVDVEIANPLVEVILPVLAAAGPMGTVWDPFLGAVAGTGLTTAAAIGLLILASARAREARPARTPGRARLLAVALLAGSALAHLVLVAQPRTGGPPHRATVLRARWYSYHFMDKVALRRQVEAEIDRITAGNGPAR